MNIVYEYSHLGGAEILEKHYKKENSIIKNIIASINPPRTKQSKERTKKDKMLYSPTEINRLFRAEFQKYEFKELKDNFKVTIPNYEHTYNSYKQIDFVRKKVLVEVQLGKYAFMFYDMAKFQYFYNENRADVGVEIVPSAFMAKQMSTGVSKGEQLVYDIERLKRHFPAVPVKVILIEP